MTIDKFHKLFENIMKTEINDNINSKLLVGIPWYSFYCTLANLEPFA